ncbi:MAG: CHAD domain-containing protein [Holophagaceae bacterium]|nr:CHAD domain-containing protein [Holophagaceae bacterium]
MQSLEFTLALHRSLEARCARLDEATAPPAWWLEPGHLHDARVATRRLRAVVELLDPEVYPRLKAAGRGLRDFTRALGGRRELDVFRALLEGLHAQAAFDLQRASAEHLIEALDRRRAKAARGLAGDLEKVDPADWKRLLEVESLPRPFHAPPAAETAWEGLRTPLEAALEALRGLAKGEDIEALHAARVKLKRARYRLEILGESFPAPPVLCLARLKGLQDALGDHHDMALLEAFLWERQAELAAAGFRVLASSLLELVGMAAEARHRAYGALGTALQDLRPAAWVKELRAELAGGPG